MKYQDKIDKKALEELCDEYDIEYSYYPEHEFEGEAVYKFYLKKISKEEGEEGE